MRGGCIRLPPTAQQSLLHPLADLHHGVVLQDGLEIPLRAHDATWRPRSRLGENRAPVVSKGDRLDVTDFCPRKRTIQRSKGSSLRRTPCRRAMKIPQISWRLGAKTPRVINFAAQFFELTNGGDDHHESAGKDSALFF